MCAVDSLVFRIRRRFRKEATLRSAPFFLWVGTRLIGRRVPGGRVSVKIAGAQRSGHHAVLHWIANALEGEKTEWIELDRYLFVSTTLRSLHINHVNHVQPWETPHTLRRMARSLPQVENLLLNYEDVGIHEPDCDRVVGRRATLSLYVKRSTLNLVASRLVLRAKNGTGNWDNARCDESFFLQLLANGRPTPGWRTVDFDAWVNNTDGYRTALAEELGLTVDILPTVTGFGGGSSFTGVSQTPHPDALVQRFRQIDWPHEVVDLLLEERFRPLLSDEDVEFLRGIERA